jgi:hypothetical protein
VPEPEKILSRSWIGAHGLQRLGKNLNGYFGETIDIDSVLGDCVAAARTYGWVLEEISAAPKPSLLAFTRVEPLPSEAARRNSAEGSLAQTVARPKVYISTGIHGDEPAGPLAVRELLRENKWPDELDFWVLPCLNPSGFRLKRRENDEGIDLNRQYLQPKAPETLAHIHWLERQPGFNLCLCLHEDWESHGFYIYELNPEGRPSFADAMIAEVAKVCPIDHSEVIEERPASGGIIRPSVDPRSRPQWPEAFFLLTHKTRLSYTLEAPSDFPLTGRVAALVAGVRAALGGLRAK